MAAAGGVHGPAAQGQRRRVAPAEGAGQEEGPAVTRPVPGVARRGGSTPPPRALLVSLSQPCARV